MGPPSYLQPVLGRKVVIRRMAVCGSHGSRDSSVGTGTITLVGRPQNRGSIYAKARDVSLLQSVQNV